jgi:hypothetical protein
MTNDQLFTILRPIILSVTGVPECILSNPNAPSPTGEYAAVQPQQTIAERGQATIVRTAKPGALMDVEVRAKIACTAWVNFYRGDARTRAARLKQCNKRPDISAALFAANLGWVGTSAVNNLTALQSERFESRAQIAINLWYETSDPVEINTIERISGSLEYEDGTVVSQWELATPDAP